MTELSRRELLAGGAALAALPAAPGIALPRSRPLSRIAFGSCCHQDKPQPIWDRVNGWRPELFIFLGDNIYGDTLDMAVMRSKYGQLAAKPGFRELRRTTEVIATWDDHDYGKDDAGREYPKKAESRDVFMDFWNEPQASPRRTREGNRLRVGAGYSIPNYGRIAIDWERKDPLVMLEVETIEGKIVISQAVALSSLQG